MFTQFLGTAATVYGVLAALKALLQTRQMLTRRTSRAVSARFLASYTGGYAIWLTYGLSTGSLPLIVVDTVGLLCGGLTLAVALSLRGSLIRPATWNTCDTTSISQNPQPQTRSPIPMPRATPSHDLPNMTHASGSSPPWPRRCFPGDLRVGVRRQRAHHQEPRASSSLSARAA
jgi:uncharacterized protein with PQ loop repeat